MSSSFISDEDLLLLFSLSSEMAIIFSGSNALMLNFCSYIGCDYAARVNDERICLIVVYFQKRPRLPDKPRAKQCLNSSLDTLTGFPR